MHDVVAHATSVIVLQGTWCAALSDKPSGGGPGSLDAIEATGGADRRENNGELAATSQLARVANLLPGR